MNSHPVPELVTDFDLHHYSLSFNTCIAWKYEFLLFLLKAKMIYYLHVVLVTSRSRIELVVWGNETVSMLAKSFVTCSCAFAPGDTNQW